MNKIKLLDKTVSNMIAAGEVVERPASVVKELLENSIDAGGKNITVEIKNGGIKYIRVADDGIGMNKEDAQTSLVRHATSKISEAADLDGIMTLGFRGEALASISSVSEMDIYTKPKEEAIGTYIKSEAGEITQLDEAGCPDGTTVIVRNLFMNVPARMKFLKKDYTEAGYIADIVSRLALARPDISLRFLNNDKEQLSSSGNGDLLSCIYSVYGKEVKNAMLAASYSEFGVTVSGYCAGAELTRPNRNMQNFFINGRYIKSQLISRAVEEAYKQEIMTGKFPVCVLNIDIDPHFVDINVHPTKLEAKFSDEKAIYHVVYWAVKNAIYSKKPVFNAQIREKKQKADVFPSAAEIKNDDIEIKTEIITEPKEEKQFTQDKNEQKKEFVKNDISRNLFPEKHSYTLHEATVKLYDVEGKYKDKEPEFTLSVKPIETEKSVEPQKPVEQEKPIESEKIEPRQAKVGELSQDEPQKPIYKICGQVFDTYIIIEKDGEMLMIDQHAAHERLRFEELKKQYEEGQIVSQMLLTPHIASVTHSEMASFCECEDRFFELGFCAEQYGETDIIIRSVPEVLAQDGGDLTSLLLEITDMFISHKKDIGGKIAEKMLYSISCKGAVKANRKLNELEMRALIDRILLLPDINTCPHGRPIIITFTKDFIEKQFKRIV